MINESILITLSFCILLPIVGIVAFNFIGELIISVLSFIFPSIKTWRSSIRKETERINKIKNSYKKAPRDNIKCSESRFHNSTKNYALSTSVSRKYLVGKWEHIETYSYTTDEPSPHSNDYYDRVSVRKTVDVYNFDTKAAVTIQLCDNCIRKGYRLALTESSFDFIVSSGCLIPLIIWAFALCIGPLILFRNQKIFQDLMNEFFSSLILILIPILGVLLLLFAIKKAISKKNSAMHHASCEILSEFYPDDEYLLSNKSRKKEITR